MADRRGTGEYAVRRNVVSDGRLMTVLRTHSVKEIDGTFAELWVDVERQSAVVRSATYDNDMVFCRLDIRYGKGECGWWPRKWQLTYFRFGETAIGSVYRYQVSQFEGNPAVGPELFTEEPKPGMDVRDVSRGAVYQIGD